MTRKTLTYVLGIALMATTAFANEESKNMKDSKAFLAFAARSAAAEIEQAKLAKAMAENPDIQAYTKRLIAEHEASQETISALAKKNNVKLATETDAKQKATLERLSKLNDRHRSFDREYLKETLDAHRKAIKAYETQAKNGTDAGTRAWAKESLPMLKSHLEEAMQISARLNLKSNE
jgi:putative membrane protein